MSRRFIVMVLDGFGIGAMKNTHIVRPGGEKTDILRSILRGFPDMRLPVLEYLGLINVYGEESRFMKENPDADFGKTQLTHSRAGTFMGYQKIMRTLPKEPETHPLREKVEGVTRHLKERGHKVEFVRRDGLWYVLVSDYVTVANNLEADLSTCYNVTTPLDFIPFEKEVEIGQLVRKVVTMGWMIAFGGTGDCMDDLWGTEEAKRGTYIGIASSKPKFYEQDYQCVHLGYEVDKMVQTSVILTAADHQVPLFGKVADTVANDGEKNVSCVPAELVIERTIQKVKDIREGFICTNVRGTDPTGHSQFTKIYKKILETANGKLREMLLLLMENDILVVMTDHGNDPLIDHSGHTREYVPLLVYRKGVTEKYLGLRLGLSSVGAFACRYLGVAAPQNGTPFLEQLGVEPQEENRRKGA